MAAASWWRLIFARDRPHWGNGSERKCRPRTRSSSGRRLDLRAGFMCSQTSPNFNTNARLFTIRRAKEPSAGTIRESASSGRDVIRYSRRRTAPRERWPTGWTHRNRRSSASIQVFEPQQGDAEQGLYNDRAADFGSSEITFIKDDGDLANLKTFGMRAIGHFGLKDITACGHSA